MTAHEFLDKEYFYLILDSRGTNIYSEDIEKAMADFARYKCKELLEIVAEKARADIKYEYSGNTGSEYCDEWAVVDKKSILNCVDLENFCVGTVFS